MSGIEPPNAAGARTAAEFVDRMGELRLWAGQPSLRTLSRFGSRTLPATTVSWVLNGKGLPRLPRMAFVEAYVSACLTAAAAPREEIERQLEAWRAAWRSITASTEAGEGSPPIRAYHQLPMDIPEFTGRQAELGRLRELAGHGDRTTPVVVTITGMAGVGKTRLATRAAHQLGADRFDQVQLWADLRGFHPEQAPATAASVLENFLRLLGVPAHQIPDDVDGRAALYRDRLAGQRALVVLDDAEAEEQVRPLLPGTPDCLVLITSRRSLAGLDGTHILPLTTFGPREATQLLGRHAGDDRVRAEPEAARRLSELCGHLPLAVAVTARYLRGRPALSLRELAARLATDARQLTGFSPHARSVRTVFDLSYRALAAGHQRVLRLLAIHPGKHFAAPSVAALAAVTEAEAQTILDDLLDEHLLHQTTAARHGMHDLVRQYLTQDHGGEPDRPAALVRLIRHYLDRARHATLLIHPTENRRVSAPPTPAPWRTPAEAVAWTETEYDNLVSTVYLAADAPGAAPTLATELVAALYRPLANRGHATGRIELNHVAARLARRNGDRHAEAQLLEDLGTLHAQVGHIPDAVAHSHRALAIWTELDDPAGRRGCLVDLGNCCRQQGDHDKARAYLQQALAISTAAGDRSGEASVLNCLGLTYQGTGEFDTAIDHLARSVAMHREAGNRLGEAIALANQGWAVQRSGHPAAAIRYHQQSLEIFRTLRDRYNEAEQHWAIGQAEQALGDPAAARHHWHIAITMLRDIQVLDDEQTAELLAEEVPHTPELIRLNT
jgi:tetratricopeptide (TPR) repeat protein